MMITLPKRIVLCGVSRSGKSTLGENLSRHFGHVPVAFADPLKCAAQAIFGFADDDLWGPSHTRETPYPAFAFSGWCFTCNEQCAGPERHCALLELEGDATGAYAVLEERHSTDKDFWRCETCGAGYGRYVTPREALKTLGTEWGRRFCPELWASACFVKMRPNLSYVVTDCRFRNERAAATRYRSCTVLLTRGLMESTSPHASEAEVRDMALEPDAFDLVLENSTGSAEKNFDKLVQKLEELFRSPSVRSKQMDWHRYEDRRLGL